MDYLILTSTWCQVIKVSITVFLKGSPVLILYPKGSSMAYPENMIVPILGCLESGKLEGRLGPVPGDVFYHISGTLDTELPLSAGERVRNLLRTRS